MTTLLWYSRYCSWSAIYQNLSNVHHQETEYVLLWACHCVRSLLSNTWNTPAKGKISGCGHGCYRRARAADDCGAYLLGLGSIYFSAPWQRQILGGNHRRKRAFNTSPWHTFMIANDRRERRIGITSTKNMTRRLFGFSGNVSELFHYPK